MADIIKKEFEFTKEWTDADDFPTREYSESQVRDDIQYLFDEIKTHLNDNIHTALNNHENRIAALGGGGTVEHDAMGEDSIWEENIIDDSISTSKIQNESVTLDKLNDDVTDYLDTMVDDGLAALFQSTGPYYDDLVALVKRVASGMTLKEWGITKT